MEILAIIGCGVVAAVLLVWLLGRPSQLPKGYASNPVEPKSLPKVDDRPAPGARPTPKAPVPDVMHHVPVCWFGVKGCWWKARVHTVRAGIDIDAGGHSTTILTREHSNGVVEIVQEQRDE